jgi:hypothetical protein
MPLLFLRPTPDAKGTRILVDNIVENAPSIGQTLAKGTGLEMAGRRLALAGNFTHGRCVGNHLARAGLQS